MSLLPGKEGQNGVYTFHLVELKILVKGEVQSIFDWIFQGMLILFW